MRKKSIITSPGRINLPRSRARATVWSTQNTPGNPDGSYYNFTYDGSTTAGRVTAIDDYGLVNPTPNDGTSVPIQSGYSAFSAASWLTATFVYTSTQTSFSDSQGHATTWLCGSNFGNAATSCSPVSTVQTIENYTGSQYLVTDLAWDNENNLTSEVDPRGNETDYAYDTNGNTIAMALPPVASPNGTFRPTTTISYDQHNNVVAYCDPNETNSIGENWVGTLTPNSYNDHSDSICPQATGAVRYAWTATGDEPFDKLATETTTLGYARSLAYDAYGEPLTVMGAAISQVDGSELTPTETFTYNQVGSLTSYNKGGGTWALTYDGLNRPASVVDPDPGNPTTCTWYNVDGTVAATETPSEHALTGSGQCSPLGSPGLYASTTNYDLDGNAVKQSSYRGRGDELATKTTWYDGADRVVEVEEPYESKMVNAAENDYYPYAWLTRYVYDLSRD